MIEINEAMWDDLFDGAIYGLFSIAIIRSISDIWWVLLVSCATSLLWMLGGIGWLNTNAWRRIVMPLLLCSVFFYFTHSGWVLVSLTLQITWLYQGYSVEDVNQTKASWLGKLFGKWTKTVWLGVLMVAMIPMLIK